MLKEAFKKSFNKNDLEYYVEKYEHTEFTEFQKTEDYTELYNEMKNNEINLNSMTILMALFAWYYEKVRGLELPTCEPEPIVKGEIKSVEVYDQIDYNFKYGDLLEQESQRVKVLDDVDGETLEKLI